MSKSPVLSDLVIQVQEVRKQLSELAKEEKDLRTQKEDLEQRLIAAMDAVGTNMARANGSTASISETVVAVIDDYDKYVNWVSRNKAWYLFERRVASAAYRDLLETRKGRAIPGLRSFTKRSLNLRTS